MNDDTFEREVDNLNFRYSTIPELILLLKQLRLNDPQVKHICIEWRKLPTAYINTFFTLLSENTFVTHVKISQCTITDEVVDSIANFIRCNRTVIDLDLSRNCLSDTSAKDIADALTMQMPTQPRQTLRKLTLQGNDFTDVGIITLSAAMCRTNIQVLKIGKMSISDVGAVGIASMLMDTSCPIRKLDLRSSSLGSSGTSIVGKALAVNTSLEILCIGKNNVGDDAIHDLVAALQNNETLRTLDVQYNPISDIGANYFARCLDESNYSLRKLKLRHCDAISDELKETLLDILVMNSYGPELAFKTKDALRSVLVEESSNSDYMSTSEAETNQKTENQWNVASTRATLFGINTKQVPTAICIKTSNETCVICFEKLAACILLPCRHRNCCASCASKLKCCHMCRETIVKIFQPILIEAIANEA
jgi:Zinc finger, C3HC4 type (RING finger)/Leucine Rich repeat